MTAAISHTRALEAPFSAALILGPHRRKLPTLGSQRVRLSCEAFASVVEAPILPLGKRGGLLRARRRDSEPSRCATDGAAGNENQGDSETSSVHPGRVARSEAHGKAWS